MGQRGLGARPREKSVLVLGCLDRCEWYYWAKVFPCVICVRPFITHNTGDYINMTKTLGYTDLELGVYQLLR